MIRPKPVAKYSMFNNIQSIFVPILYNVVLLKVIESLLLKNILSFKTGCNLSSEIENQSTRLS